MTPDNDPLRQLAETVNRLPSRQQLVTFAWQCIGAAVLGALLAYLAN